MISRPAVLHDHRRRTGPPLASGRKAMDLLRRLNDFRHSFGARRDLFEDKPKIAEWS
jgi:hypothetical protein